MISCCLGCVAPKRQRGCHDRCSEYIAEKKIHDSDRKKKKSFSDFESFIYEERRKSKKINQKYHKKF